MAIKTYSLKKDGKTKLSKNFTVSEFACHDGSDSVLIDSDLVTILQKIRDWAKSSVIITSGYRTVSHNRAVSGVSNSYHTKGQAADIVVRGKKPIEVARFAESIGVKGIGCYNDDLFNHIDTRTSKYFWFNQSCTQTSSFCQTPYPTVKKGDRSQTVKILQTKLISKGYKLEADGIFGEKTFAALKDFQLRNELTADGIAGKNTWAKLG